MNIYATVVEARDKHGAFFTTVHVASRSPEEARKLAAEAIATSGANVISVDEAEVIASVVDIFAPAVLNIFGRAYFGSGEEG